MKKIILPVFVLAFLFLNITASAWWSTSYKCKAPINVSVSLGTTKQNHQVFLNISYATYNCSNISQIDFDDYRFINGSENAELDYWIESYADSDYANIWVEIDQNITTSGYTIYMYYGNAALGNSSSGNQTFDYYNTSLLRKSAESVSPLFGNNYAIKGRINFTAGNEMWGFSTSASDPRRTIMTSVAQNPDTQYYSNGSGWDTIGLPLDVPTGIHIFEIIRNGTNNVITREDNNASYQVSHVFSGSETIKAETNANPVCYWTLVRKWYYPEPVYSIGAENESSFNISIDFPTNTTYYNNYSLDLNVSNNTDISNWWYLQGGGINISFTPNTNFVPFSGNQNIIVYANDTAGNWYSSEIYFTVSIACNSTVYENDTICGGTNLQHIIECKQFGVETYQWDFENITYCEHGCFDGRCLAQLSTCKNRCVENETMCLRESIITCEVDSDGCYNWNDNSTTWCEYGCFDGHCNNGTDFCNVGETKCGDEAVIYCDDDDSDGFYEWSKFNITHCEYRCQQTYNIITQRWNASCHYHSYTVPELIFTRLQWLTNMGGAVAISPLLQMSMVLVIAIVIAILAAVFGSWRMGVPAFFGMMLLGTVGGWMPWYITFIMIVLGGIVVFRFGWED